MADQGAPRYSIFGPDGTLIGTRVRRATWGLITERCTIAPDGSYMEWGVRYPNRDRSNDPSDVDLGHYYPVRVSPDAEKLDTLPHLEFVLQLADLPSAGSRRPAWFGARLKRALGCRDDVWFASRGVPGIPAFPRR